MLGSWPEAEPARTGSAAAGYTGIWGTGSDR